MIRSNKIIKKFAIIGASGFLGSFLFSTLVKNFLVIGTYFSKPNKDLSYLDLREKKQVRFFFEKFQPHLVIICGGLNRPDDCELNRELAYDINVKGIGNITKHCKCKLIYFSTDYVFDGKRGFYSEKDTPNPINYYGWTKLKAEEIVMNSGEDNAIIRVAGLYGFNERNNEFLNSFNSSIIYKSTDLYGSTLLIDDMAKHLPFFVKGQGIYHLASGSNLSRYNFALLAFDILGLSTKIIPKAAKEMHYIANRPQNTSLVSIRHSLKVCKEKEGLNLVKRYLTIKGGET